MRLWFTSFIIFLVLTAHCSFDCCDHKLVQTDSVVDKAYSYLEISDFNSAFSVLEKSLKIAVLTGDACSQARLLKELAVLYEMKGEYQASVEFLMMALKISQYHEFDNISSDIHNNLGILYFNMKDGQNALDEYIKSLRYAIQINDTVRIIKVMNNIGNTHMTIYGQMETAEDYFQKSINLAEKIGWITAVEVGINNLIQVYLQTERIGEAEKLVMQSYLRDSLDPFVNYNIANFYLSSGAPDKSILFFLKALDYSEGHPELKGVLLNDISSIYAELGNYKLAYHYHLKYSELKENLNKLEVQKYIVDLETRYETEKKDQEIYFLTKQKNKVRRMVVLLVLGVISLLTLVFFLILYLRNQKIISRQKDRILKNEQLKNEQEKILVAIKSGLKGEEEERNRLSRDLHDGLGSFLSGLKLTMLNVRRGNDNFEEILQSAIMMVDASIDEVKRIAANIAPEILINSGVIDAIHEFCADFHSISSEIKISFGFYGNKCRFIAPFELALYRIAQELINNAVKHSGSLSIDVQLIVERERVFLSVTDFGFETQSRNLIFVEGKGLNNVKKRAESFGGRFEIFCREGRGTECVVEFDNIKPNLKEYD